MNYYLLCLILIISKLMNIVAVTVCKTPEDYWTFRKNENCFNDPTSDLNFTTIIRNWGYSIEEYTLETKDNYFLYVVRILPNRTNPTNSPILLAHGMYLNADSFVYRHEKSIAKFLADKDYEVWLPNFRGTIYSTKHRTLNVSDRKFWDYSLDEIGVKDLDTIVDFIVEKTGKKLIIYGFSMGTTVSYIYAATYPEKTSQKLKGVISAGPTVYIVGSSSLLNVLRPVMKYFYSFTTYYLNGHIAPVSISSYINRLLASNIVGLNVYLYLCNLICGPDYTQVDSVTLPVTVIKLSEDISAKLFVHYYQIGDSGEFKQFDYGTEGNLVKYNKSRPDTYNFSNIAVPVSFHVAPNDILVPVKGAKKTFCEVNKHHRCGFHIVNNKQFKHDSFLTAKDIVSLHFQPVLETIQAMDEGKCSQIDKNQDTICKEN